MRCIIGGEINMLPWASHGDFIGYCVMHAIGENTDDR